MGNLQLDRVLRHIRTLAGPPAEGDSDAALLGRFAACREEAAFAALLGRHGPMVLGVSRRVLRQDQDAEDVFQATFLLLARKAGSIRKPESVACWLHGVAQRLAIKAKAQSARRQAHERQAADMRKTLPSPEAAWQELQAVLDDALQGVPAKYRSALVLCHLEGKTVDEAARQLGHPPGTVKSWLARGRKLLHDRLVRRGLTLSASGLVTALVASAAPAAVPAALWEPTFRAALRFSAGEAAASVVSAQTAALVEAGFQVLFTTKKAWAAILLAMLLLGAGAGVLAYQAAAPDSPTLLQPAELASMAAPAEPPLAFPRRGEPADPHGDLLPPGAIARLGTVRFRHADSVERVAFSPNGKTLASWSRNALWLWEAGTGKLGGRIGTPRADLQCLAFFPDGTSLAVLDAGNGGVYLWDFAARKDLPSADSFRGCPQGPTCCAVSADGRILAVAGKRSPEGAGIVRIYQMGPAKELRQLKELCHFDAHPRGIGWLVLSPDGRRLLVGGPLASAVTPQGEKGRGEGDEPRLWDVAAGGEPSLIPVPSVQTSNTRTPAIFAPDGRTVALAAADKTIRLWDAATGRELRRLSGHAGNIACLVFSPDGHTLASGGFDRVVRLWDLADGRQVQELKVEQNAALSLTFSPDGRTLASAGPGSLIRLWDVGTGGEILTPAGHESLIRALVLSADGRTVATASEDRTLRLWEAATGRELRRLSEDAGGPCALAFSPDGQTLARGDGHAFRLWDIATGEELRRQPAGSRGVALAFSPDGSTLACVGRDHSLCLWDAAKGRVTAVLEENSNKITALAFSPDGRMLATAAGAASARGPANVRINVWDVAGGRKVREFSVPLDRVFTDCWITALAFSPDGKALATTSFSAAAFLGPIPRPARPEDRDRVVRLWEIATGQEIRPFPAEPGRGLLDLGGATSVAFSPDGRTVAAGGWDSTITLHEVATGKVRHRLQGHHGPVRHLTFTGDSKFLASASDDLTALVWDLSGQGNGREGADVSSAQLDLYWQELASDDASQAYRAIRALAAFPLRAVPYLGGRLVQAAAKGGENTGEPWNSPLPPDNLRLLRAIEVLEQIATVEARQVLARLAQETPQTWFTAEAKTAQERLSKRTSLTP